MRPIHHSLLVYCCCAGFFLSAPEIAAQALISGGVFGAPALQTIQIQEATITEGYQLSVMPQAGLRLRYHASRDLAFRVDGRLFEKGANLFLQPDSGISSPSGLATLKAQYIGFGLGGEYRRSILPHRAFVGGSLDFAYGRLRQTSLRIRDGNGSVSFADFFFQGYAGLDLGVFIESIIFNRAYIRFSPTLEVQLNHAYHSDIFQSKFVGFAPRLELCLPLIYPKTKTLENTNAEPRN